MLDFYPESSRGQCIDEEKFKNPPSRYRGAPFWAWNGDLIEEDLLGQIQDFKDMGMGGFHVHARYGLRLKYMGEKYLQLMASCFEEAKKKGMLTYLYDEDRWPSGTAGGIVTAEHPEYASRHLLWTKVPYEKVSGPEEYPSNPIRPLNWIGGNRSQLGTCIGRYQVKLSVSGFLESYKRLKDNEVCGQGFEEWYAYDERSQELKSLNGACYVNTLDKCAIEEFIKHSHEVFENHFGCEFGKSILSIFSDEPQFPPKTSFELSHADEDLIYPWTSDIPKTFKKQYGFDILDFLPELFWDLPGNSPSLCRYSYHDHVSQRFTEAFNDTIGEWCNNKNLYFTGHMMHEESLESQTEALGEAMRTYRSMSLPGIDILQAKHEWATVKQAQSISRQFGRPGVTCEIYGVTNWDFDFRNHKATGDWLAACGVTFRVPHLTWASMAKRGKRDYPATFGYQSPWCKEYSLLEDYFARINVVMTRGKPIVSIGVIHPIESYWLYYGPWQTSRAMRDQFQDNFDKLSQWLLFDLFDFDYISESLLPEQCRLSDIDEKFPVGSMKYDVIIVAGLKTVRSTTLERLVRFKKNGGTVIFAGNPPSFLDACKSSEPSVFASKCIECEFLKESLLSILEPFRQVSLRLKTVFDLEVHMTERLLPNVIYQLREENKYRYLFLVNTDVKRSYPDTLVTINGYWKVTFLDTLNCLNGPADVTYSGSDTHINWSCHAHGSLLLKLEPCDTQKESQSVENKLIFSRGQAIAEPVSYFLDEDNLLLLDTAEYCLNGGIWHNKSPIIKFSEIIRRNLQYPNSNEQPYMLEPDDSDSSNIVTLRFQINSDIDTHVDIAMEDATRSTIFLDGVKVQSSIQGWWVDKCIQRQYLGHISIGSHELLIKRPFTRFDYLENIYVLGKFGVSVVGKHATITQIPKTIMFGNLVNQRLSFYSGNVSYQVMVTLKGPSILHFPDFSASLLKVYVNDKDVSMVAFSPFDVKLDLQPGEYKLTIKCFGNRFNTFGQLHNNVRLSHEAWWGPNSWMTEGDKWADEYQLRPYGILVAPIIKEIVTV